MKRLILITACFTIAASAFGQSECSKNNAIYKFDNSNGEAPKEIRTLGSDPEFNFMRNLGSPHQVYAAIKKCERNNPGSRKMTELNNMLMDIGFANGAKDLNESDISMYYIPPGTEGNMGSGKLNTMYCKLVGSSTEFKSWKITSPSSSRCYVYILAKCGNAFYPKEPKATACLNVPVTLTGDTKEVTLQSSAPISTTESVYIYYHKKHHRHEVANANPDIPDAYPSAPLMVSSKDVMRSEPETYKVSVTTPQDQLKVCQNQAAEVEANLGVEKISQYTGYYPGTAKKNYKEVSKRVYRRTARKMRKVHRKEERVARLTHANVNSES